MPFVEREPGVRVHYDDYGQGRPLVFLHGYSCNAWIWAYQVPLLAHRYRCIVIEARGHGRSSKPLSGYSIQDMAADDAAVLAALGIDRAILVGNSMGGMRSMQICLDNPDLVAGNLVISSATNLTRFVDSTDLLRDLRTKYEEMTDEFVRRCFSQRTRHERPEICSLLKNNLLDPVAFPAACGLRPGRTPGRRLELGYYAQAHGDQPAHTDRGGRRGRGHAGRSQPDSGRTDAQRGLTDRHRRCPYVPRSSSRWRSTRR